MTTPDRKAGASLPDRRSPNKDDGGVLAKISRSTIVAKGKQCASDSIFVTKKLWDYTAKAAWMLGISFVILAVPLIIEADRDQQIELELQQGNHEISFDFK